MAKIKVGDKVRSKENHELLQVSRRNVGVVKSIYRVGKNYYDVEVKFRHKIGTTIFQYDELKKVKR